jgi:hypothetical protein
VSRVNDTKLEENRKLLVERVAASRHFNKSARLRDLLVYLCERGMEGSTDIHEQEIGHKVFGRPADYDTGSDNIVRVHASMLRKRLEQYFAEEGAAEPLVLEIPRGNYAPVFRERVTPEPAAPVVEPAAPLAAPPVPARRDWRLPAVAAVAALLALSTALLLLFGHSPLPILGEQPGPTVRAFWAQVFHGAQGNDIVLDDAAVALYQELTGHNLALSEYFDRSYIKSVPEAAQKANLDETNASAILLHRYSSYAHASFLWKLFQLSGSEARHTNLVFARDYSFHGLKNDSAVLMGNPHSNPWIEPFLPRLGLRWQFDKATGTYYPVDTWAGAELKIYRNADAAETREGYVAISLVPNLGGNGNVLIVSATGGSAFNAAAAYLADEASLVKLRQSLPAAKGGAFPNFEALVRVKGRSSQPKDSVLVIGRAAR